MNNKKYLLILLIVLSVLFLVKSIRVYSSNSNEDINVGDAINKPGDVNMDGKVNSLDYVMVRKYIMKTGDLSVDQKKYADVNSDNTINSLDYVLIRKIIMGTAVVTPTVAPATPVPTATPMYSCS